MVGDGDLEGEGVNDWVITWDGKAIIDEVEVADGMIRFSLEVVQEAKKRSIHKR